LPDKVTGGSSLFIDFNGPELILLETKELDEFAETLTTVNPNWLNIIARMTMKFQTF
jgi:hypothetical protein